MAFATQGVGMTTNGGGAPVTHVQQLIEDTLDTNELTYSRHEGAHGGLPGLIVELPGERRLKTNTILSIGEHSVRIEAFVCRKPDENHEGVYRFLLKRNRRLYGVAYTLDNVGDIYLVGRMALASVDAAEIDRVLGQVLEAVDTDFNTLLELGFRSSIQKEWEWRVSRGESLKNLEAFAHLIEDETTVKSLPRAGRRRRTPRTPRPTLATRSRGCCRRPAEPWCARRSARASAE